jgi:hypothetical protein
MNQPPLQSLVTALKECMAHEAGLSREIFLESWDDLRREEMEPLVNATIPIIAALVLSDDRFKQLLNGAENTQLVKLARLALERYEQQINPPNKLGKLMAGIIKKESI